MEQNLTYSAAFAELENIALEMEQDTVSIDDLALRVKRAAELIALCQHKLRDTEKEVAAVMASMEEGRKELGATGVTNGPDTK